MSVKKIYNILAILLGYGLIIGGFIVFGESVESKIKILDIIVSCLLFTQFVEFAIFPLINFGDPSHKEVGMMGIHIAILCICCTLSLGLIICGIVYKIPFKFQFLGQLVILFILLIGRVATLHSGEKVQNIYAKELEMIERKKTLMLVMDDFSDYLMTVKQLDSVDKKKIDYIHNQMRFITPSANTEAKSYDDQFVQSIKELKVLMRDTTLYKEQISEEIEHLERILERRRKY